METYDCEVVVTTEQELGQAQMEHVKTLEALLRLQRKFNRLKTALQNIKNCECPPSMLGAQGNVTVTVAERYIWIVDRVREMASKAIAEVEEAK